ncbi:hypothetical protein O3P69_009592 [Scylla paramamosain]|uniref:Uncharacterized protein n=1 Tax=Scylla paramamosain TaxID=85552 RepID=A0AAW0SUA1_SCYPA
MGGVTSKDVKKYPRETLCDHDKGINCMATSEDGSLLVTGAEDKTARLWDIRSRETECIGIMRGHTSYITCVAVHDTFIVTGAADATLRKWDTITCDCLFTYRVLCTGEYILSSSQDKTTKAWHVDELILDDLKGDADDIACIKTFEARGHVRAVYPLMVDPGEEDETGTVGYGDLVVTGSLDCTARSWDFVSGNCLQVLWLLILWLMVLWLMVLWLLVF